MAGLVPATTSENAAKTWMPATSAGMTAELDGYFISASRAA
jgi:hypothetical protein